jgi:hypothetical protein
MEGNFVARNDPLSDVDFKGGSYCQEDHHQGVP